MSGDPNDYPWRDGDYLGVNAPLRPRPNRATRRAAATTPHQHGAGNGEKHGG